ncbi:MAG TPA: S8 family peptidase, partial [Pyrinomonadaceae bacterium]
MARETNAEVKTEKVSPDLRERARRNPDQRVMVVLQSAGAWSTSHDGLVRAFGANVKRNYQNFDMRAIEVPARVAELLAMQNEFAYVSLDREVRSLGHISLTTGADAARKMTGTSNEYNGTDIGIAVIDSGIYQSHVSFMQASGGGIRIPASVDFTDSGTTADPYGHGTHVASIAAANPMVAQGAYLGIAPNANILNLRVLDGMGKGSTSALLAALDWVYTNRTAHNIRVVNLSLGTAAVDSYRNDAICKAARKLVDAGIVVVAAAGNEGRDANGTKLYGQIHSPGNEPSVITVGASNSFGTDARTDDVVTTYSSRGPTRSYYTDLAGVRHYDNLVKPDLVAPGNKIIEAQSASNYLVTNNPQLDANVSGSVIKEQMYLSGTSMATPVVSGAAALLLQANPGLTPNLVKAILQYTAQPLAGYNNLEQGAGQVNLEGAMRLARLVRTDLSANTLLGAPLLTTAVPTQTSTVARTTFNWGGSVTMKQTFVT